MPDPHETQRLIESSAQIHMRAFQVALGVLTGLALLCFVARMTIRLKYHKKLGLDDVFLIIAAASLIASTGILYHICYFLYLHSAALLAPQVLPILLDHFTELLQLHEMVYPFLALIWTATYAVKACFLAFMRPLVWHISRAVNWYYWFIVVFCTISWAFVVAEPFIICPYFGLDAVQCFSSSVDNARTLGPTILVTILDILSDAMVVSIPIIVLRSSLLSRSTKIGLGTFLCLSIVMAIFAIIRIAGFYYNGLEDDIWEFFWQHAEGSVAVMMASVTAFRTLFVKQADNAASTESPVPAQSPWHRFFGRFQALARAQPDKKPTVPSNASMLKLPQLPSPIFTGMRSFIRRNNRTDRGATTWASLDSIVDDAETDYHAALQPRTRAAGNGNIAIN